MPKDGRDYKVGHGKPPVSGRFTAGKSGNPKGRPKGSKNLTTIVLQESRQPVRINGPKGPRFVTKLQAAVMQMSNKAAQGHLPSQREFISLIRMSEDANGSDTLSQTSHEMDQQVMQSIMRRMRQVDSETTMAMTETEVKKSE